MRLAALLFLVLITPSAASVCTSFGCANTHDTDRDGDIDGVSVSTSTFIEEAPTVSAFLLNETLRFRVDAQAGHEDDDVAHFVMVEGWLNATDATLRPSWVDVEVESLTPASGEVTPLMGVRFDATDPDGDEEVNGIALTWLLP